MQLQIQEDLVSALFDLPHNFRALGIVELHADLHKRLFLLELIQESVSLLCAGEVQSNDHVALFHFHAPPIMSVRDWIPYFSMTLGSSAMILGQT